MAEFPELAPGLAATPVLSSGTTILAEGVRLCVPDPPAMVRLQVSRASIIEAHTLRIGALALPTEAGRCVGDDPAALWLAPDGWLVVSGNEDGAALAARLRDACAGLTAAAVDVSDSLVTLELRGARIRDLLVRGTGLTLNDGTFNEGFCARTRFAQLAVILWPRARDRVSLIVDRGPAQWLHDWLIDAGRLL
jgi:heterotetrameric sarcosine oxidase gamma subunit